MGLEAAQYLHELNLANPTFQDFMAEGDDHLRNFKRAAQQTFPGMAGRAWRTRVVSASAALALTDNMTLIKATQTLTLTPAAASVLGNGWMVWIRATGGTVTIDPSENINGAANMSVPNGYTAILMTDGSEFYAILVYQEVPTQAKAFPTGTKMLFNQTSAPVGWTKQLGGTYDNAAIRNTTGTVGVGGVDMFTTTFGTGKSTSGHTLTEAQLAPHTHTETRSAFNDGTNVSQGGPYQGVGHGGLATVASGAAGGGGSHSHGLTGFNIKYVDTIVASID